MVEERELRHAERHTVTMLGDHAGTYESTFYTHGKVALLPPARHTSLRSTLVDKHILCGDHGAIPRVGIDMGRPISYLTRSEIARAPL